MDSITLGAIVTTVALLAVVAILWFAYRFVNEAEGGNRRFRRVNQLIRWRRRRGDPRPIDEGDNSSGANP